MSVNVPGWIPGAPDKDDVPVCGRCGHHASAHLHATSGSARAAGGGAAGAAATSGLIRLARIRPVSGLAACAN
jgi:hypothetical protein